MEGAMQTKRGSDREEQTQRAVMTQPPDCNTVIKSKWHKHTHNTNTLEHVNICLAEVTK